VLARIILILVLGLAAAGCGGGGEGAGDPGRLTVAASFYPLAYAAEQVGGDRVDVWNVTPPGAEPHDVELSPRDVQRIRDADVVLYVGGGFQPAVEEAAEEADGRAIDLLAALEQAPAGEADPHVWLDPTLYAAIVRRVGGALGGAARAAELELELRKLDADLERGVRGCARRDFVTSHAAFGYFARRYGLEQLPISGLSPEAEPSPGELADAVERVRELGVSTIFVEELVSADVAETIARETGAAIAPLSPIEGLTEEQADAGEDYFTLMRKNLRELRRGLRCT
jgi:zinc transport system substrate-binding protein